LCLTLLPQPIERRHDIIEDLSDTERVPATGVGDRVRARVREALGLKGKAG
jgi:hypothetical protein